MHTSIRFLLAFVALALAIFLTPAKPQVLSLPVVTPVACSAQAGCSFMARPNTTAILIGRITGNGAITGSLKETWTRDQCVTFTADCIFHANFGAFCGVGNSCTGGDKLTFSGNAFSDVLILVYDGGWSFDAGNFGTYANQNSVFPDCKNGGDCPYSWTLPIETEAGALIICWGEAGGQVIRPGPWFTLEGHATYLFAEDLIAPATGTYIGSWMLRNPDGTESGGAHWLAGVAAYKKKVNK
jgi:hypothetical protein